MKFNFEYNRKESGIPVMNIEQDNHIYQLYIGTDCHVHLVEDSSKEFTSSTNLESCLNCSILSKRQEYSIKVLLSMVLSMKFCKKLAFVKISRLSL